MSKSDDDQHRKDDAKQHLAEALKRKLEATAKPHDGSPGKPDKSGKMAKQSGPKSRNFRHQGR